MLLTRTVYETNKEKQGLITRTLSSIRSNSLAETGSVVWDLANTDNSGIFEPKVKACREEDYRAFIKKTPTDDHWTMLCKH